MNRLSVNFLFFLLFSLAACAPRSGDAVTPATAPDIRGTATKVNVAVEPRTVLVEEQPEETSGSAKAMVKLTEETRILRRAASEVEPATPGELAVGQTVSVWFSGPVLESFPVQVGAAVVVIEEGP
jgi:hypothetical protein